MYTEADPFNRIDEGEIYYLDSPYYKILKQDKRWRQVENKAVEEEICECVLMSSESEKIFVAEMTVVLFHIQTNLAMHGWNGMACWQKITFG